MSFQREPPERQFSGATEKLRENTRLSWDRRFVFEARSAIPESIDIGYSKVDDIKKALELLKKEASLLGAIGRFVRCTPATHFHIIPVIKDRENPEYLAFPTLGIELPQRRFAWRSYFCGKHILVSKFLCLP